MFYYLIPCVGVTIDKISLKNIFIYYHIANIIIKEVWNTTAKEMNNYLALKLTLMLTNQAMNSSDISKKFVLKIDIVKKDIHKKKYASYLFRTHATNNVIKLSKKTFTNSYTQKSY